MTLARHSLHKFIKFQNYQIPKLSKKDGNTLELLKKNSLKTSSVYFYSFSLRVPLLKLLPVKSLIVLKFDMYCRENDRSPINYRQLANSQSAQRRFLYDFVSTSPRVGCARLNTRIFQTFDLENEIEGHWTRHKSHTQATYAVDRLGDFTIFNERDHVLLTFSDELKIHLGKFCGKISVW